MALAQQVRQQVRLTQPHRAVGGQIGQFCGVATGQHLQFGSLLAQQLGVDRMVVFGNQNAHGSNL